MSKPKQTDSLKDRVEQFMMLKLPGQPMMMHMGTSYLVQDLWYEVKRLQKELDAFLTKDALGQ